MINQKLIDYALRQAGLMIAEHLELGHCDAEETTSKLIAMLDAQELTDASDRRLGLAGGEVTPFHAAMKEVANWGGLTCRVFTPKLSWRRVNTCFVSLNAHE